MILRKPFNSEEIKQFANALTNSWDTERERELLATRLDVINAELEDMNVNLKKKVEKQAGMLIQSAKMSALGVLAAGVAHEINNPVSFVQGNLVTIKKYSTSIKELLSKYIRLEVDIGTDGTPDMQSLLAEIQSYKASRKIDYILEDIDSLADESLEGAQRISEIVKDLKVFSHRGDESTRPADLNDIIEKALNIVESEIGPKTQIVKAYGDLPPVTCYPQKLGQVFVNILMNAAQAVGDAGRVHISTRSLTNSDKDDPKMVEVSISDNGCGISEVEISKVFDPFFTTKPVGRGTGLGLSISYDIVRYHGGELEVESVENEGTSVRVALPLTAELRQNHYAHDVHDI